MQSRSCKIFIIAIFAFSLQWDPKSLIQVLRTSLISISSSRPSSTLSAPVNIRMSSCDSASSIFVAINAPEISFDVILPSPVTSTNERARRSCARVIPFCSRRVTSAIDKSSSFEQVPVVVRPEKGPICTGVLGGVFSRRRRLIEDMAHTLSDTIRQHKQRKELFITQTKKR